MSSQILDALNIANDQILDLLAQLTAMTAERDALRKELAEATETWTDESGTVWRPPTAHAYAMACNGRNSRAERAESERDALAAHGVVMREALRPFAEEADNYDDALGFPDDPDNRKIDDLGVADITVGHLRAARSARADQPPQVKAILDIVRGAEKFQDATGGVNQLNALTEVARGVNALRASRIQGEDRG